MAIDHDNFGAKLALRRYFLRTYHGAGSACPTPYVFDACQATGQLWKALRAEFTIAQYFGVDLTLQRGRLCVDSTRVLASPGWSFDVIDVDTYGTPWNHWEHILRHGTQDATVFLTVGRKGNTQAPRAILHDLGMGRIVALLPHSMCMRVYPMALLAQFARALKFGWRVVEVREARKGNTAQYFGVRLERVPVTPDVPLAPSGVSP